mmetsp:Transcript_122381/g.273272  ORF Transcript_122381/g.273272 Transcript_122381/m.273272 type:complete len:209 (+) Transcript_122381:253-879(+)
MRRTRTARCCGKRSQTQPRAIAPSLAQSWRKRCQASALPKTRRSMSSRGTASCLGAVPLLAGACSTAQVPQLPCSRKARNCLLTSERPAEAISCTATVPLEPESPLPPRKPPSPPRRSPPSPPLSLLSITELGETRGAAGGASTSSIASELPAMARLSRVQRAGSPDVPLPRLSSKQLTCRPKRASNPMAGLSPLSPPENAGARSMPQ